MLYEYVSKHCERGACQCGKCIDSPENPVQRQPKGHTADLVFFEVILKNNPIKEEFLGLVKEKYPQWLDGKEHNYMEMGGDIGDQGTALMAMGLGSLLGVWQLLTPRMLPIPEDLVMQMAGKGMITIQTKKEKKDG